MQGHISEVQVESDKGGWDKQFTRVVKCNGSSNGTTYLDLTRIFLREQYLGIANWDKKFFFLSPHVKSFIFCIIKSPRSCHQCMCHYYHLILHTITTILFTSHIIHFHFYWIPQIGVIFFPLFCRVISSFIFCIVKS